MALRILLPPAPVVTFDADNDNDKRLVSGRAGSNVADTVDRRHRTRDQRLQLAHLGGSLTFSVRLLRMGHAGWKLLLALPAISVASA